MPAVYRFGSFELQPAERRLLAEGLPTRLGPRAFDLLVLLVERAGHLLSKEELFQQIWPRVVVDDGALQAQISSLRKILGPDTIATISGRGYRFVRPVDAAGFEPSRDAPAPPMHNLPQSLSTFIGRESAIARLEQSLDRARLVTLTGAGGCGKTRLAMRAAAAVLARHADGVWLVELAALADASLVPQALMSTLGLAEVAGEHPVRTLSAHLAKRQLLLLLDNAEHLLPGCAELADTLLRECRGLTLLITSREKLGLVGELSYRVPSLSLPEAGAPLTPEALLASESARLFVDRARLLRPHFAVTAENATALAAICHRLDGIPLAIELAAARMRTMSVQELSQRLDQRFSLLSGGLPGAQSRHRTLRSLIDWSFDLLSEAEQALLCRLSVFAGGCTLQAAEAVCSAEGGDAAQVLDLLAALSDKSLLVTEEQADATRYRLLETVLAYARERLTERGETAYWHARHVAHFVMLAETAWPQLRGPEKRSWLARLEADQDNLRAALSWSLALSETAESGMRIAAALTSFWLIRGPLAEARSWYAQALAAAPQEGGDPILRATLLNRCGIVAAEQDDLDAAKSLYEQALVLHRQSGNQAGIGGTLSNLGGVLLELGDYAAARALQEESAALYRVLNDSSRLSQVLANLGTTALHQQDYPAAQATLEEALQLQRALGDLHGCGNTLGSLAGVATQRRDYGTARHLLREGLAIFGETGDRRELAQLLEELAHVESSLAPSARAARLWGAAEQLRADGGSPIPRNERAAYEQRVSAARQALADDPAFDQAWQAGRQMSLARAVQDACADESSCPPP